MLSAPLDHDLYLKRHGATDVIEKLANLAVKIKLVDSFQERFVDAKVSALALRSLSAECTEINKESG